MAKTSNKNKTAPKPKKLSKKEKERLEKKKRRYITFAVIFLTAVLLILFLLFIRPSEGGIAPKQVSYPLLYREEIEEYAGRNGLESAYVASVVMAESSYDSGAVSSVGARGLMQIMPETGKWIAGKLNEEYTDDCLFDPETNLRYGCWYLGYLMNRYGGDMRVSSAAYHSGQGTVDGWLSDENCSSDGKTLSYIPGDNARSYVGRISEYYDFYSHEFE